MQVNKIIFYQRGINNMSGTNQHNQGRKRKKTSRKKVTSNNNLYNKNNNIVNISQTNNSSNENNKIGNIGNNSLKEHGILKDIIIGIISGLVVLLVGNFLSFLHYQSIAPYIMESDFNELEKGLTESINTQFSDLKEDIIKYVDNQISKLEDRVKNVESALMTYRADNTNVLKLIDDKIINATYVSKEMEYVLSTPIWDNDDIIFENIRNTNTYQAEDFINEKILLTYKIGDKENYFYGQYNEYNQWDGDCVVNVYENNKLQLVMEAEYDNGILLTYKQINKFTTKAGINVWNISNRTNKDNYTCGENWYYFRGENEYEKIFSFDNVTSEDIITIDLFEKKLKDAGTWLEGYYCGNTQDGHFNDKTGNAFMIKYFEDGTIRTFYVGNFEDGDFVDTTGNAWYIAKDVNTEYMYYKGVFEDGHPAKKAAVFVLPEEIEDILFENNFNPENIDPRIKLNWNDYTL